MSDAFDSSQAERPQRQSCCLTVFALGCLVLFGALFLGHSLFTRHYERKMLDRVRVSREDLQRWLAEPVDVPPEYLEEYPDDSEEYVKHRIRVFEETLSAMAKYDTAIYTYPERPRGERVSTSTESTIVKLIKGTDLNTTDARQLGEFQPDLLHLLQPVDELVQDPAYRYFARSSMTMKSPWSIQRKLLEWAVAKHVQGDTSSSLYCVQLAMRMYRRDLKYTEDAFVMATMKMAVDKLKPIVSETTDTTVLRQILTALEEAVGPPPSPRSTRFVWVWPDEPLQVKRMVEEGYLERMPVIRGDYVSAIGGMADYLKWLRARNPKDSRIESLATVSNSMVDWGDDYLKKLWSFRGSKRLFPQLYYTVVAARYYGINTQDLESYTVRGALVRFYLLHLAQHIARLEGNTRQLTTPQDFVPEYLTRFPADPFTTGALPLRYVSGKGFFSVGMDGLLGTADDLSSTDALKKVLDN